MTSPTTIEIRKSVLNHMDGLTQWAFLLNGAAAAGLLTFLGNSLDKKSLFANWPTFATAMTCFAAGLLAAVFTRFATMLALSYLGQVHDPATSATPEELRIYLVVGDRAVICGLVAMALFFFSSSLFVAGVLAGKYAIFG